MSEKPRVTKVPLPEGITLPTKFGKDKVSEITIKKPTSGNFFDYAYPAKVVDGKIIPDMKAIEKYLEDCADVPIEDIRALDWEVGADCAKAVTDFLGV